MDQRRILRVVLGVTAGYLILLALWLGWVIQHTPQGTVPYQIVALVGLFGSCLGVGLLLASRPPKEARQLWKHGLEGWATVAGVHPLGPTDHHTELTELDLELTVPGSESYRGTVVLDASAAERTKFAIGETLSVRVDPGNRERIIVVL